MNFAAQFCCTCARESYIGTSVPTGYRARGRVVQSLTVQGGSAMRKPHVDDFVRLTQDIPELSLNRGSLGVVRSTWFAPTVAYEVEFHKIGCDYPPRALLLAEQVQ